MRVTLRLKIIAVNLGHLLLAVIAALLVTSWLLEKYVERQTFNELEIKTNEVEFLLPALQPTAELTPQTYASLTAFSRASRVRLTLIDSLGWVRFDSEVPMERLRSVDNHLRRPEVQQALVAAIGRAERWSTTVHKRMLYMAKRISKGPNAGINNSCMTILRVARPASAIEEAIREVRWQLLAGGGVVLVLIAGINIVMSKKLTDPIGALARAAEKVKMGNLNAHFVDQTKDDIGDLASVLNEMVTKLREDVRHMETLQTMRSQFLGNVSHELRTPIFALQGYLETLLHGQNLNPDKQRLFIEKAYQNASRLNNLLTDLIDISRIESREMQMSFREIAVHEWLERTVAGYAGKEGRKDVHIRFANEGRPTSCRLQGDRERLTQVMTNLIQNAINYNRPNGAVTVGYEDLGQAVRIYVSDTGPGIKPEHLPRIFERFYRVDRERSRAVGGTGLGLAIVKHILEAHGSKCQVKSVVGEGSTFSFVLRKNRQQEAEGLP